MIGILDANFLTNTRKNLIQSEVTKAKRTLYRLTVDFNTEEQSYSLHQLGLQRCAFVLARILKM
jgi:hypothetical protein